MGLREWSLGGVLLSPFLIYVVLALVLTGALRMLVLLHFYRLGYSSVTLAFLFLLYEAAGILANLIGGSLFFNSDFGHGSTFTLALPAKSA